MLLLRDLLPFTARRVATPAVETRARYSPSAGHFPYGFSAYNHEGVTVSDSTSLALPTVWRCVNLIADALASMPLHAYRDEQRLDRTPSLLERPNVRETRYDTIFSLVASALLRGNAYAILGDFDPNAYPRQLLPVHPDDISPYVTTEGELRYRLGVQELSRTEVLHVRGFVYPGAHLGLGIIESQRAGLAHGIAQQEYGSRFYTEAAVPPLAITVDGDLDATAAADLADQWNRAHGQRHRAPAVLTGGMDIKTLSITPEDAQFIQSRQFSTQEIANMFGVPGYMVGAPGSSMTYTNTEQESVNFLTYCLRPWMMRFESAFSDLIPRGTVAKFNPDSLLRMDTLSRYQAHAIALDKGFLTLDEVRALEDLPPLPEEPKPEPVALPPMEGTNDNTDPNPA